MKLSAMVGDVLFPGKCVLCRQVLEAGETDLCRECRADAPEFSQGKLKLQFIDSFAAVWYYKENVRLALHRFKFRRGSHLAEPFGRLMAMKLLQELPADLDAVTWVPISTLRRLFRGYDQDELLARTVARELGLPCRKLLKKVRHNRPQSGIEGHAKRRANVLGVYRLAEGAEVAGQRILLVDDILTTGATAGECARVLLTAGAKEIHCAVVAAARNK